MTSRNTVFELHDKSSSRRRMKKTNPERRNFMNFVAGAVKHRVLCFFISKEK